MGIKNAFISILMKGRPLKLNKNGKPEFKAELPQGLSFGNSQHIGRREEQQDSFGISDIEDKNLLAEKGVLAVVADGMGGLANGREASSMAVGTILDEFAKAQIQDNVPQGLQKMVTLANNKVYESSMLLDEAKTGSTVGAIVIKDSTLYWISVGDSRIYLYRDNKISQLTRDHVYGSQLDEDVLRGKISFEEARDNPDRKALTSYLGAETVTEIDQNFTPFTLLPGDRIILCTDGIYGSLDEAVMEEFMQEPVFYAAEETVRRILAKNLPSQDNMTIIVVGYE